MTNQKKTPETFAIVTPSFALDFERCALLARSVEKFARLPYRHYIIVPQSDVKQFQLLSGSKTRILVTEDLIPGSVLHRGQQHELWQIGDTHTCSGWVLQQLVKIAASLNVTEDIVLFSDSDTAFIRPFDASFFIRDEKVRFFRKENFYNELFEPWIKLASSTMNLPPYQNGSSQVNYISNLVSWIPRNVQSMCDRIEKTTGKPWMEALAVNEQISEYILYGMYVDHVLGDQSGHYASKSILAHEYWVAENLDDKQLENFLNQIGQDNIAVMISAKAGIRPKRYKAYLDSLS